MDVGTSEETTDEFTGLEAPPVIKTNTPGREFSLHTASINSLDIGSPLFFRQLQAGQVTNYALDKDGKGITLKIFVNAPFDKFVTNDTRFWNASGLEVKLDAGGIKLEAQSLISILTGGIAFETPSDSANSTQAAAQTRFDLFPDHDLAMKIPDTDSEKFVMTFNESVRGLEPGAPVDFLGVIVGEVTATRIDHDKKTNKISVQVEVKIYPSRLSRNSTSKPADLARDQRYTVLRTLLNNGLRAQLRTGNLLTGQLYIALDFFPGAAKTNLKLRGETPELPTTQSSIMELQTTITALANKINKLPIEEIGSDLKETLQSGAKLLKSIDSELAPEARLAIQDARKAFVAAESVLSSDSPLQHDARHAMRELSRASQAIRQLVDYLDRHPEALIRGKQEE
jgi:paraquat-inducible protein B